MSRSCARLKSSRVYLGDYFLLQQHSSVPEVLYWKARCRYRHIAILVPDSIEPLCSGACPVAFPTRISMHSPRAPCSSVPGFFATVLTGVTIHLFSLNYLPLSAILWFNLFALVCLRISTLVRHHRLPDRGN